MTIDFTSLIDKINPQSDGEDVTRLRKAIVDAINSDGTVDLLLSNAVVPNISVLANVSVTVGSSVVVLSHRGSLLVLGPVGTVEPFGTYTPTITGTGSNPIINGTSFLNGKWWRTGRHITAIVDLFIDSAADFGGSSWRIGLPFTADSSFHTTGLLDASSDKVGTFQSRSGTASQSTVGSVLLSTTSTLIMYGEGTNTSLGASSFDVTGTARLKIQASYLRS